MASDDTELIPRRAGAPRLIGWTGERCVPWAPDAQVVYEHLHRYLWTRSLVWDRRVLDLASGEGFGAAMLAKAAASVTGIDIDERSVEHSRLNYQAPNLSYQVADAHDLSLFDDHSFDVVVAFEMIEHVDGQDRVLDEVRRVLAPEGLLIISTPDKATYRASGSQNRFHVNELTQSEFVELLRSRFEFVTTLVQRTITGSALVAIDDVAENQRDRVEAQSFFVERQGDDWRLLPALPPIYLVAVASARDLAGIVPRESLLADPAQALVRGAEARAHEHAREQAPIELAARRRELERLRARSAYDARTIAELSDRVRRVEESVTWQTIQRVRRRVFKLLGGQGSTGVQAIQATLRRAGRTLSGRAGDTAGRSLALTRARPRPGQIKFAEVWQPQVSLVIPLYSRAALTEAALWSIHDHTDGAGYEVILVDDSEDPATKRLLERVRGARVIVNDSNVGYMRSVARGVAVARGRWLVLCNNDIEVQPGWLPALLDRAEARADIAVVAPKFVYPDGSLAEAGAVIWSDGSGANYGRGDDPSACHYEYAREIDYGSAAALMVKREFWEATGGFDERFLPMYYEDTDLCFQARARGLRVMYEPRATVIHAEGASAGTDESSGHKRHQALNRPKFAEKWGSTLAAEHLENTPQNLWLAANLRSRARVLVVDHFVPMWDRDSGSLRMRGILETLLELGCRVTLLPDNGAHPQPYTSELQRLGVEVLYGVDPEAEFARIGASLSLVVLSRPQVASRWLEPLRRLAPGVPVVFDTVDLHWLRESRRMAIAGAAGTPGSSQPAEVAAMRELENALIRSADATIVVTEEERRLVLADAPQADVRVIPNLNRVRADAPPVSGREGVLFVGGFQHTPNVDAVLTLVEEVMPLVWTELPDVVVRIVGADPPARIKALSSSVVEVTGWLADLEPAIDTARVMLAPLTYGAGLKGKVTQALAFGLPVVTTPIGAEGLDAISGEQLMIGTTPEELAAATVRVLRDDALWETLSRSGQTLAAERCSSELMSGALERLLETFTRQRSRGGVPMPMA